MISDAVVFAGVVPLVPCARLSAAGHQEEDARWSTVLSGTIDAGLAGDTEEPGVMGYSTDQYGNYAPILVPVNGLKVVVEQGNIASHWSTSWRQYYLSPIRWPCHLDMTASFSMSGAPQVDPDTCVVSFKGTPELKVTGGDDFLSACNITPLQLTDAISGSLQPLASLQLMQLDTFALANLVFPSGHKVRLTSAKLPQDLILQGTMVVPLTVQPDRVSLTPGATEQFSIAGGESVSWAVQPASRGTISNTGLYTAPATPSQTEVVTINAVSTKDLNRVGRAMAVIAPARPKTGISISPNSLRVSAGKTIAFTVTNDAGTPLEASVDLNPVGLGTLLEGFGTGQWTYSAPSQIAQSATVRIVAKSADKTGEAAFEIMPASVAIDITPKTASVAAGGSVRFTAKATGDLTWLAWPVGTVAADDAGAAYSAPSSVKDVQRVIVLAYSLDSNSTAGIAIAHVTVGSSS